MSGATFDLLFASAVAILLAIDLLANRKAHRISLREAAAWTSLWVTCALLFGLFGLPLHPDFAAGHRLEYFTAWLIEWALSVDNLLLFVVIFESLAVPKEAHHRVLFYGVLGAILMRTAFIVAGLELIRHFEWMLFLFGSFLLYAAFRTWSQRSAEPDIAHSPLLRLLRRLLPVTHDYHGARFTIREGGRLMVTPLLVAVVLVELTDLLFAVDSIPAVFAITRSELVALTSNILAILGLRSLYFLLSHGLDRIRYLREGLSVILLFVGLKLVTEPLEDVWHPSPAGSLAVVGSILLVTVIAGLVADRRDGGKHRRRAGEAVGASETSPEPRGEDVA
jgi:tellurite resistance protein TerC